MPADAVIRLRISKKQKALIDQAAKSRPAFIVETALLRAEEVLLDRTQFTLNAEQWEAFTTTLGSKSSAEQLEGLRKLFSSPT